MANAKMVQVKFTIDSDIVSAFKSKCMQEGVSMASQVRQFMEAGQPVKGIKTDALTRPLRRKAVRDIIDALNNIMAMEERYRDAIPEQFEQRHEAADRACEQLAEAIVCLEEAFP